MMHVNSRQVIREIAWNTYKAEARRNLLSISAICMASFFIAMMSAIGSSYWHTLTERQLRMQGIDYDIELSEPSPEQAEILRADEKIKYAGLAVACMSVEQYKDRAVDYAKLYWLDDTCWEKQTVPALASYTGHYPVRENELFLSEALLRAMHIENPQAGMKLPLSYQVLAKSETDTPLFGEFILCGWYKDYSGSETGYVSKAFYDSTGVKQTDFGLGSLKISLVNPLYSAKDIARLNEAAGIHGSQRISADDYAVPHFIQVMLAVAGLFVMVIASAYLFIFNTMYISICRHIRWYGQLKTVGMTSAQLRGVVYRQAFLNAAAGIPAGLAAAAFVSKTAVPRILLMVNGAYEESLVVPVQPWVFLASGLFVLCVNSASCRRPAKIAGSCSPVEALRYTPAPVRRMTRPREKAAISDMAWQNIFRDKKQAAVILLSSTIALSIFFTVNVILLGNDAKHVLNQRDMYDMQYINQTVPKQAKQVFSEDKLAQLKSIGGVKTVRQVTSAFADIPYQENVFGELYRALYASRYSPGNYEDDMEKYRQDTDHAWTQTYFGTRLVGVDEEGFVLLNKSVGNTLDKEAFENGEDAVVLESAMVAGDFGMAGKTVRFRLPDGLYPDEEYSIRIAAVSSRQVNYFGSGSTPFLAVSENLMKKLLGRTIIELIEIDYRKPYSRETEAAVKAVFADEKRVTNDSKLERYDSMLDAEKQVRLLGCCIGFLTAALALLNYMNTMAAAIQNREKEFAVLESIGMTRRQMRRMACMEGLGYGVISIACSLVPGTACSYAVFDALAFSSSYAVPWGSMLMLYAAALMLCTAAPAVLLGLSRRGSIIE